MSAHKINFGKEIMSYTNTNHKFVFVYHKHKKSFWIAPRWQKKKKKTTTTNSKGDAPTPKNVGYSHLAVCRSQKVRYD